MTDLGTLPGGASSAAYGINDSGQVVGRSLIATYNFHAFVWQNGSMTDLGTLGGPDSYAYAINDSGQVVGESQTAVGDRHAFVWQNGSMTDLGTLPGGSFSEAYGINGSGQVVGRSDTASGDYHAFVWQNGSMTDLGTLGGSYSAAYDINDSGQVVGFSYTAEGPGHAFLWQNGSMTDLGTLPGGAFSSAYAINDSGQVVGQSHTAEGDPMATLWALASSFTFSGFFAPLDNPPVVNQVKAGSAVPVRFSLGGDQGLDIFAEGYPKLQTMACDPSAPVDPIEETGTAGNSGLSYDPVNDTYTYVWKTQKSWKNKCGQLIVRLVDDSEHTALFQFR